MSWHSLLFFRHLIQRLCSAMSVHIKHCCSLVATCSSKLVSATAIIHIFGIAITLIERVQL